MSKIGTNAEKWDSKKTIKFNKIFLDMIDKYNDEIKNIKIGGGPLSIEKQHDKKRLTARERIDQIIDEKTTFFEFGVYAAWKMYKN